MLFAANNSIVPELAVPRPKNAKQVTRCTTTLDITLAKRLESLATDQDVSVAWLIRRAIEDFLKRHEEEVTPQLPLRRVSIARKQ
jgi:hypothetical protein